MKERKDEGEGRRNKKTDEWKLFYTFAREKL